MQLSVSPYINRFIQPDSIVPNPSNPQAWNRFGYVYNNPINFSDPSGHEPKYGCYQSSGKDCLNANGTKIKPGRGKGGALVNSVWSGSGCNSEGSDCNVTYSNTVAAQMPIYLTSNTGTSVNAVDYPGYYEQGNWNSRPTGKQRMAENAKNLALDSSLIMICYSAATEACLMNAKWRIENGYDVYSIALLGPTFYSYNESGGLLTTFGTADGQWNDWADYTSFLLQNDVDVLVIDDTPSDDFKNLANFDNDMNSSGLFYYDSSLSNTHFLNPGSGNGYSTNDSQSVKNFVYQWMFNPFGN